MQEHSSRDNAPTGDAGNAQNDHGVQSPIDDDRSATSAPLAGDSFSSAGSPDRWERGSRPRTDAEWVEELRLVEDLWRREVENLKTRAEEGQEFEIRRIPRTPNDWQIEQRLRDDRFRRAQDEDARKYKADLQFRLAEAAGKSDDRRAWVLLAVVAAVVAYPGIAMLTGLSANEFGQYIAPITGIAGTVLGYWFGQRSSTDPQLSIPPATSAGT